MYRIRIDKCNDTRKWYADQIGKEFPLISHYGEEYKVRAADGYLNFVLEEDATLIEFED